MGLQAISFDIDGTLYANRDMYLRSAGLFFRHVRLFLAIDKVRKAMRRSPAVKDFHAVQASLVGAELHREPEAAGELIDRVIYGEWTRKLQGIPLVGGIPGIFDQLRQMGLKVAFLSDFPVTGKLEVLGIGFRPDAVLCTEDVGALKPDAGGFRALSVALGIEPGAILHVGNSRRYDVAGAAGAGMRTALLGRNKGKSPCPDLEFRSYDTLMNYVRENV